MVSVSYDPDAKALYVKLNDSRAAKTIHIGEGKYLDVSEGGKATGLEVIFPSQTPQEAIDAIIGLSKEEQIKLLQE